MGSHTEKGLEMSERGQGSGLDVSVHAQAPPRLSKADRQKTKIDLMKERGRRVYSLGYFLRKLPWFVSYSLIALFAGGVIVSFFGFVPLKDPDLTGIKENAVFGFFVLPFVFTVIAYLNASMFYAALQINQPFVNTLWVVLPVYIFEAVIFGVVTWRKGCINLIGGAALLTCFIVLWAGILISVRWIKSKRVSKLDQMFFPAFMQYLKVTTVVFVWTLLLIGYIFAFRYFAKSKVVQRVLPALRNIFLFAFRKTTLHLCDSFPLDIAMLIAGFWCEQLADMFSVVSYPTVKNPKNFYVIWASNAVSLLANLLFLTPGWFRFRLWIKNWLKAVFTCNFPIPPTPPADETDIPDERGHGPNRQGYLRRQVRFFLWKVAGQGSAEALYLALVPLLRLGRNSKWFVFAEPTNTTFRYSMMFSGANLGFIILCGVIGILVVRFCLPKVAHTIWKEAKDNITDLYYVSFVIAITCANAFVVFSIVMRHMKIWYAFIEPGESTLNL